MVKKIVPERKIKFLLGWVEPDLQCWVSHLNSTSKSKIKHLTQSNFKGQTQRID